jgi:hypothetical protein
MASGLKNATSTFTRIMSTIFKELGDKFLKIYVDDLNIHSDNWEEHLQHLDAIFFKLKKINLKLNSSKCCFAAKCCAPKFLVDPLKGLGIWQCGRSWNLEHDPNFQH